MVGDHFYLWWRFALHVKILSTSHHRRQGWDEVWLDVDDSLLTRPNEACQEILYRVLSLVTTMAECYKDRSRFPEASPSTNLEVSPSS